MASDGYRASHLRTITFLSAGAALLAVLGYFLMKSDRKKPRRKSSSNSNETKLQQETDIINSQEAQYQENLEVEADLKTNSIEETSNDEQFLQNSFEKSVIDEDHLHEDVMVELNQPDSGTSSGFSSLHKFDEKTKCEDENEEEEESSPSLSNSNNKNFESQLGSHIDQFLEKTKDSIQSDSCKQLSFNSSPVHSTKSSKDEECCLEAKVEQSIETNADSTHVTKEDEETDIRVSNSETFSTSSNLTIDEVHEEEQSRLENKTPVPFTENNTNDTTLNNEPASNIPSTNKDSHSTSNENSSFEFIEDRKSIEHDMMSTTSKSINGSVTSATSPGKRSKKRKDSKRSRNSTSISSVNSSISSNAKNSPSKKKNLLEPKKPKPSNQTFDIEASDPNDTEDLVVYEFNFPRKLCGKLIGKNGVHVDFIRSKTQTQIAVRNDSKISDLQVVCVSGRISDVDKAIDLIGNRFPSKLYPQISFKPITKPIVYRRFNKSKSSSPVDTDQSKILVTSTNFVEFSETGKDGSHQLIEVQVTAIVNAGHVFVQLPKNPTYNELQELDKNMLNAYDSMSELVPNMNEPIDYGTICAAPTSYGWHRAMITSYRSHDEVKEQLPDYRENCGLATVKFLDYGGYLNIPVNQLRQLRSDFMVLPFQGIECYLDGCWNTNQSLIEEGRMFLSQQIKDSLTEALVMGYSEDGMPLIRLFISNNMVQKYCLNDELGKLGLVINFKNNTEELLNNTSIYNQNVQNNIFNKNQNDIVSEITNE